jgi:hypothetical protein
MATSSYNLSKNIYHFIVWLPMLTKNINLITLTQNNNNNNNNFKMILAMEY